jgi:hypothetical protein
VSQLTDAGVSVTLPTGCEGRIVARRRDTAESVAVAAGDPNPYAERTVVLQVATFALPADMGDFGGGGVTGMGATDVLVVLFEYGSPSVGTPLFAAQGIPRLRPRDFSPDALRLMLEGQSGVQRFFTVAGRAFCVYAVIGAHVRRIGLCGVVNDILASVRIT